MVKYSIIVPLYNEEENFEELFQRVKATMDDIGGSFEIVFIDDGSDDSTFDLISRAAKMDRRVLGVKLSRNFGQDNALLAGMQCSEGESLVLMDGDLQDPPEFIARLIEQKNMGYSVVYGVKYNRKENVLIKLLTFVFYKLLHFLSKVQIPRNAGTFSIISRTVAQHILYLRENNKFVSGLRAYVGFKQFGVLYERQKRGGGKPKTLFALIRMGLNAIFSFSILPLRITMLATLIMGLLTLCVLLVFSTGTFPSGSAGFSANNLIIFCISSLLFLLLISLTIVCEYIGRLHDHIKKRPDFIIESIVRAGEIIDDFYKINSDIRVS